MKRRSNARHLRSAASITLAATLFVIGCSEDPAPNPNPTDQGFGISSIKPAANDPSFKSPFDATPDPKGEVIYFTALTNPTEEGEVSVPAVFAVASSGGAVRILHQGPPLASPFGIAISEDGQNLFVADGSAEIDGGEENGAIFRIPIGGGAPSPVAGTAGLNPRGIEIQGESVYFTGKKAGLAGVYKMSIAGSPAPLVEGPPLRDPAGIAITKKGEVFTVDSFADEAAGAAVMRITQGKAEVFKDGLAVGMPAGITVVGADTALLVSGLDPQKLTDVVFRVDLGDKSVKTFSDTIGAFYEASGLHRARNANVYAWADSSAPGPGKGRGTVFFLQQ